MQLPESRLSRRPDSAIKIDQRPDSAFSVESNTRPFVQQEYTELPAPESPPKLQKKKVEPVPLLPTTSKDRQPNESKLLCEGTFDELESHNSFIEALNAWRGAEELPSKIP